MPIYQYEAIKQQKRIKGFLSSESRREAAAELRKDRVRILKLIEHKDRAEKENYDELLERSEFERAAQRVFVRGGDVEQALSQVASLLKAGVPIVRALKLAARLSTSILLKRSLYCTANRLVGGGALHEIMKNEMPFLSNVTLSLIAVGEANGTLEEMFEYAGTLMGQSRKVKGDLIQALSYPLFVILMAVGAMTFLMKVVIPKIIKYISSRGVDMPPITQALIDTVDFLEAYGLYLLISPIVLILLIALSRKSETIALLQDRFLLVMPFLGKVFTSSANAMWSRTLGVLLHSGVHVIQALRLTSRTLKNSHLRQQFVWLEDLTKQGHPLSTGVRITTISSICPLAESMLSIGENTGLIDQNLAQVAQFYQDELERRLAVLSRMIEPALIIVVGGIVAFVYIGFFLGLMALSQTH